MANASVRMRLEKANPGKVKKSKVGTSTFKLTATPPPFACHPVGI